MACSDEPVWGFTQLSGGLPCMSRPQGFKSGALGHAEVGIALWGEEAAVNKNISIWPKETPLQPAG